MHRAGVPATDVPRETLGTVVILCPPLQVEEPLLLEPPLPFVQLGFAQCAPALPLLVVRPPMPQFMPDLIVGNVLSAESRGVHLLQRAASARREVLIELT